MASRKSLTSRAPAGSYTGNCTHARARAHTHTRTACLQCLHLNVALVHERVDRDNGQQRFPEDYLLGLLERRRRRGKIFQTQIGKVWGLGRSQDFAEPHTGQHVCVTLHVQGLSSEVAWRTLRAFREECGEWYTGVKELQNLI